MNPGFSRRLLEVIRRIRPEIHRHRAFMIVGTIGSFVVVACRLSYALPLKGVLDTASGTQKHGFVDHLVPAGVDPVVGLIVLFLVIASLQGVGEYFQRVRFARFAIAVSRDVRARAFATLARDGAKSSKARGEALSRVVGDTSRFKSGIKGVLIRYTQNGVFFVGVLIALAIIDPRLGVVFLAGGLAIVVAAMVGAARVSHIAVRLRKKEGKTLARMNAALSSQASSAAAFTDGEGGIEAKTARAQQQAVFAVHVLLGLTVGAVILLGVHDVRSGVIQSSDLVLVLFFLVQVHNPVLKLSRSTMRLGRALASAERLLDLANRPEQPAEQLRLDLWPAQPEPEPVIPSTWEPERDPVTVARRPPGRLAAWGP
jgi:ABC-type multidrug transport system fused ATPase/permease subunit